MEIGDGRCAIRDATVTEESDRTPRAEMKLIYRPRMFWLLSDGDSSAEMNNVMG